MRVKPDYLRPQILLEPKKSKTGQPELCQRKVKEGVDERLYRLEILEKDNEKDTVKVRYIGYDSNHDEWRPRGDIVDVKDELEEEDGLLTNPVKVQPFCLYDELAKRIKVLLVSNRKGDPVCSVCMSFDTIYFDGLARRSTMATSTLKKK